MEVILLKDIPNIGKKGEIKQVKEGFAINYLIKNNYAVKATEKKLKEKTRIDKINEKNEKEIHDKLLKMSEILNSVRLTFILKQSEDKMHVFGSITNKMIADNLLKAYRIKLDKKQIIVDKKLNTLGEHKVSIRIHKSIPLSAITVVIKGA